MPLTQFELIPPGIAAYKSEADFASKAPGTPAPRNAAKPTKLWRDNAPVWNPFAFWGGGIEYKFFAKNPDGTIALTPIDRLNPLFTSTYNYTVVNTLVENAYLFPNGVPFLVKSSLPTEWAAELNIEGNPSLPPVDFPVKEGSFIFVPTPDGRSVIAYDDEEFRKMARPPKMTDEERLAQIKRILDLPGMSATLKIGAIRKAITSYGGDTVIT